MPTVEDVRNEIRQIYDPEIPVNVLDLGLIYDVELEGTTCNIRMTLTSQSCPSAKEIPDWITRRVNALDGIDETKISIVWEPQWSPHMITEEGKKVLGIDMEDEDE